ncbi:Phosphatase [Hyella patelloides LEGE 07179]|uniref:Phosphatase n=1 Tax=Hyella patelloides LEGE 07179 TaxID=945734 RepID=A0A563VZZ1_9CYAN|nr:alkaline phosphatase PhoX [Hyella patelloides]VEP16833.1 Phosphatase [Hyella patelloides LEGE 07179]
MTVSRRNFLIFLGASTGSMALSSAVNSQQKYPFPSEINSTARAITNGDLPFAPVKIPIPLNIEELTPTEQITRYASYEVQDDLVLPEGYKYQVIAAWGDRVGDSRFGYNNDYLSFVETAPNEGFLTINFEYISGGTWMSSYPQVIGKELPFAQVKAETNEEGEIDAFTLADDSLLKAQIKEISQEGLIDQGMGVISVRRNALGEWERTYSKSDRRITGISGLENSQQLLKSTGAATRVFRKKNKLGYEDNLGDRIIGTFQNCAGGTTPWGTVLSAEENVQDQIPEVVMADGSSMSPSDKPFLINDEEVDGRANVFGLAGNKYGWLVEIDPANPGDYGTKHTWLGRYRHEAFGIRAEEGKQLVVYSGCDRRGGHLYKFISNGKVKNPQDKSNSRLFNQGMLYGAKFNADGTGEWIPLNPNTPVNPVKSSEVGGGLVKLPNPDRLQGGAVEITSDLPIELYQKQFKTLSDLYQGDNTEQQGAILIDAHYAANAAGITCTARPEDTIVAEDGTLFIAFTSGSPGSDGGADLAVFQGPDGETDYEYGWLFKLEEENSDPAALSFSWSSLATGGEPANGGAGFANPDNIAVDKGGNLWIVTDMSTSKQNIAVPSRIEDGAALSGSDLTGVFGNNSLWYVPMSGNSAGEIYPFAIGPTGCECTGPFFSNDRTTLFLAIQHPGERNGIRQDMAIETRDFELLTTDGATFKQQRQVPLGSNWPSNSANQPPRPAIVAITKIDGNAIS